MKIAACYKLVPVNEQISINADRTVHFDDADWEIGTYDLNAVEAAVRLAADSGRTVTAVTVGGEKVNHSKLKKAILSRGPDEMFGVLCGNADSLDSFGTASLLKAAIEAIGDVDLVICGEGSVDQYAQQVGPMVGTLLGWNTINAISKLDWQDGKLIAERVLDDCTETLEIGLPAVISVTSSINKARIPGMRDILNAGKKPSTVKTNEELGAAVSCGVETVSTLAPKQANRLGLIFDEANDENIAAFADLIRKSI